MFVSLLEKFGVKFNINDPRWGKSNDEDKPHRAQDGKKPGDGPPDLDQLWRDFNQRLNRLLGSKNGGGGGGSNNGGGFRPDARGAGIGAGILVAVVAFLWLVSGFFTI